MNDSLIVIYGGMDSTLVDEFDMNSLMFGTEIGRTNIDICERTEPDEIVASLITGRPPSEHGIHGSMHFTNPTIRRLESYLPDTGAMLRRKLYTNKGKDISRWRRYISSEIEVPTVFDIHPSATPICLPSYNPEIQWLIFRNTIRPGEYPELGVDEAEKLIEKNFFWRRKQVLESLEERRGPIIIHFQYIDSIQHIHYEHLSNMEKIESAYRRMSEFSEELLAAAEEHDYDDVVFMSEYGLPRAGGGSDSHHRRPFYYRTSGRLGSNRIEEMLGEILDVDWPPQEDG